MVAPARATPIQIAAITDEFSPDLDIALDAMQAAGVTGVELRTIHGTNIVDLPDVEIRRVVEAAARREMPIVSLASPLLKCVLPDAPPIDERFQQDVFGSPFTFDDQPRLTRRVFELAELTGAGLSASSCTGARSIRRHATLASSRLSMRWPPRRRARRHDRSRKRVCVQRRHRGRSEARARFDCRARTFS